MIPNKQRIAMQLKDLRRLVDTSKDPCEYLLAYAMETGIIWATQDTEGWKGMAVEAKLLARLLREELL